MDIIGSYRKNALLMTVRALSSLIHTQTMMATMLQTPGVTILAWSQEDISSKKPFMTAEQRHIASGVNTSRTVMMSLLVGMMSQSVILGVSLTAEDTTRMELVFGTTSRKKCEPLSLKAARPWMSLI